MDEKTPADARLGMVAQQLKQAKEHALRAKAKVGLGLSVRKKRSELVVEQLLQELPFRGEGMCESNFLMEIVCWLKCHVGVGWLVKPK